MRFGSEKDLEKLGFKKISSTQWAKSPTARLPNRGKTARAISKSGVRGKLKETNRNKGILQEGVRYRVVYEVSRNRLLDYSNVMIKWYEDRLVHYGILPDDSPAYVADYTIKQFKCKKGEAERIVIKVYGIEE